MDDLIIHIQPETVKKYAPFSRWYGKVRHIPVIKVAAKKLLNLTTHRIVYSGDWDKVTKQLHSHWIHIRMEDILNHLDDITLSETYKINAAYLERKGQVKIKGKKLKNTTELRIHLEEKFVKLINSIKLDGYRADLAPDLPCAMIGRNGEIIKTRAGRHRFATAQLVRPKDFFPLRVIAIHAEWMPGLGKASYSEIQQKLDMLSNTTRNK